MQGHNAGPERATITPHYKAFLGAHKPPKFQGYAWWDGAKIHVHDSKRDAMQAASDDGFVAVYRDSPSYC